MEKKLLVHLIWFFIAIPSLAQDSLKIIILSPKVGDVIDKNESKEYSLFKQFRNFNKVFFYKESNDRYYGRFSLTQPDGFDKDTSIHYPEITLLTLAEKIENWEKIKIGDYEWGETPSKFTVKGEGEITFEDFLESRKTTEDSIKKVQLSNAFSKQSNFIEFSKQSNFIEIETYPEFSAGTGLGLYYPDFSGIKNAFYLAEQRLIEEGSSFEPHANDNFSVNPLWHLFFKVTFIKEIEMLFEISDSFSEVDFKSVLISLLYNYRIMSNKPLFVFAGAGIGRYDFKIEKKYFIGLQDGGTLESINVKGKKSVLNLSAGVKYEFTKSLDISLSGSYSFASKMETTIESADIKTSVELKGFSGSLMVSVGF